MYINFEQLAESGMSFPDLMNLLAIRQKDDLVIQSIEKKDINKYIALEFVEHLKSGMYRLTKKGASFLNVIETPGISEAINETLYALKDLYEAQGKEIGLVKEAEYRLCWFMNNTNFKHNVICNAVKRYLASSGEYTLSLCNLIWKPPSIAFSVHMSLRSSKLFDLIAEDLSLGTEIYFVKTRTKEMEWLFSVSRLPYPATNGNPDYLFTGDPKREKERLINIKKCLLNRLKELRG